MDVLPAVPPVIVSVPKSLGDVEVLVRHQEWGEIEVDVRPMGTRQTWTPIELLGGGFTVRER